MRYIHFTGRSVFIVLSVAVTASILGYLFSRISLAEVLDVIANMNRQALLWFLALSMAMSIFRAWRFAVLLRFSGYRPNRLALFLVVIVRNFFSDLLPARLGTLVYVYLATQRLRVPFGAAASSFAVSFLFDMIALAPLLVCAAYFAGAVAGLSPLALLTGAMALLVASILVLAALPKVARLASRLVAAAGFLPEKLRAKWASAISSAGAEVEHARRGGIFGKVFALSLGVRVCKYASLYVLLYALVEPLGYRLDDMPISLVTLGLVAPELAASLPISGIGGFGAYEGAWALVFGLLVFPQHVAELTALSHHLFTQVYGALLGAGALLLLSIPEVYRWAGRRWRNGQPVERP